jgi:hypothetical protein
MSCDLVLKVDKELNMNAATKVANNPKRFLVVSENAFGAIVILLRTDSQEDVMRLLRMRDCTRGVNPAAVYERQDVLEQR